MDPAAQFAGAIAAAGAAYLVAGLACDGIRAATRLRLPGLPSLRPLLAAVTVLLVLGRAAPAGAALPPPARRLGPAPAPAAAALAPPATVGGGYVVAPGDSLWAIAHQRLTANGDAASTEDVGRYWRAIYDANRDVIGADPNLIHPGQVLDLPGAP